MLQAIMQKSLPMPNPEPKKRSGCPISYSLDVFGDRWTLLILRDLILFGKQRFREFLAAEEGIASNILSDRLKRLEVGGIVVRDADPDDGRQRIYRTTEKGKRLTPVLLELAAWGATHDEKSSAPTGFADAFYADRESFYRNHQERLAELAALDERSKNG